MLAGDTRALTLMGADGDVQAVVLLLELLEGDLLAHGHVGVGLDTQREDGVDLRVQLLPREAVAGDAVAQHAAQLVALLEDDHLVAHQRQIVGAAQAAGAAADDGHGLSGRRRAFRLGHVPGVVHGVALQAADVQGRVDHVAAAPGFAGVLADIGAGGRHGVILADQAHCVGTAPLAHQCHIAGHVHARRAQRHAGHRQSQAGKTPVMLDMLDIIVPEALQAVHHQTGRVTADGAVGGVDDAAGGLFNDRQRGHVRLTVQHHLDQLGQLAQSDTAGHALAAGLGMAQLQKGQRHIHRAQAGR